MALVCFPEGDGDLIREDFWLGPVDRLGGLVVIAPARRAGDPGSNPGPGENFSLKLLIYIYIYIASGQWPIWEIHDDIGISLQVLQTVVISISPYPTNKGE